MNRIGFGMDFGARQLETDEFLEGFLGEATPYTLERLAEATQVSAQVALDDLLAHRLDHDPGPRLSFRSIFRWFSIDFGAVEPHLASAPRLSRPSPHLIACENS